MRNDDACFILTEFANNLAYSNIPKSIINQSKMILLDTIGVMLGATTLEDSVIPLIKLVKKGGGKKESSIIGFGGKYPCWMAAFANGALSHALDYTTSDDYSVAPGGVTVPSALAMAERNPNTTGKQLIMAITVANEILTRIGGAINKNPMGFGWVSPMLLGVFGSAVAAGYIIGLNKKQLSNAVGIALHQASGTWEMAEDPTSTFRSIRNSFVNKAGVLSALLAQADIAAANCPLEGKNGLFHQYYGGNYNRNFLIDGLGSKYQCGNISFKPYPSCRVTHSFIDATLNIVKMHNLLPEDITKIKIVVGEMGSRLCFPISQRRQPKTSIEAKFSIPFTIAVSIVRRKIRLIDFTTSMISDPQVLKIARLITCKTTGTSAPIDPGIVEIIDKNGRVFRNEVYAPSGSPKNPISKKELIKKFNDCITYSKNHIDKIDAENIIAFIDNLENEQCLSKLFSMISCRKKKL